MTHISEFDEKYSYLCSLRFFFAFIILLGDALFVKENILFKLNKASFIGNTTRNNKMLNKIMITDTSRNDDAHSNGYILFISIMSLRRLRKQLLHMKILFLEFKACFKMECCKYNMLAHIHDVISQEC